ncbi:hypothetical protein [Acinetobacter venetianus]|uniref:hypothetical protein n=1 Tax=Acinetobacter venetianus TaxID=52133 RepID=UPI003A95734A
MVISGRQCATGFFILSFLLVPFLSFYEVKALINGTLTSQSAALTPMYIKILKDILQLTILLVSSFFIMKRKKISIVALFLFLIVFFSLTLSLIYSSGNDVLILASGFRWLVPFFLISVLTYFRFNLMNKTVFKFVILILSIHFFVQLFEFFWGGHWYGSFLGRFSLRNPGIFLIPGTGAMFTLGCYLILRDHIVGLKKNIILLFTVWVSVALTASGSAVICLFMISIYRLLRAFFNSFLSVLFLSVCFLCSLPFLISLSVLLGRGDSYVQTSGGERVEIFLNAVDSASVVSDKFGIGTNTGVVISNSLDMSSDALIVDSMYTSMLVNLGWLGFTLYLILCLMVFFISLFNQNDKHIEFSMVLVIVSFTSIWLEAFPFNLICIAIISEILTYSKSGTHENMYINRTS